MPASAGVSSRDPTGTHTPTLALRTPGIASVTTRSPPGSVVRVITPPPLAPSRRVCARRSSRPAAPGTVPIGVILNALS